MVALVAPAEEQPGPTSAPWRSRGASADQRARDWDASLLNNIGMTYADAGDFTAALASFE